MDENSTTAPIYGPVKFDEAYAALKEGFAIKRGHWHGYWKKDSQNESISMYTKDGKIIDIRDSEDMLFTINNMLEEDWFILGDLGEKIIDLNIKTLTFGEVVRKLKQGKKVARLGWNGKGMYLWMKPAFVIKPEMCSDPMLKQAVIENGGELLGLPTISMYTHDSTGRKAVLTGWVASQSDIFSEDWVVVE